MKPSKSDMLPTVDKNADMYYYRYYFRYNNENMIGTVRLGMAFHSVFHFLQSVYLRGRDGRSDCHQHRFRKPQHPQFTYL